MAAYGSDGGFFESRVVAQVQVVVRAEHQHLASVNLAAGC